MPGRAETGQSAEDLVAGELRQRGFEIVARNARVGRLELDIIARRGRLLVICEVRSRTSRAFGSPALTIGREKIARIRRATGAWLKAHDTRTDELRFDVAAVTFDPDGTHEIQYYERAF